LKTATVFVILFVSFSVFAQNQTSRAVGHDWGPFEGSMPWKEASAVCSGKGMRLPTREELLALFSDGPADLRACGQNPCFYWSSTFAQDDAVYSVGMVFGYVYSASRGLEFDVRCVK